MKYRKEIDGLRAVAIIPVLLFHSGIPYLSGGYLGVDVFFVISGFLITSIIFEEAKNDNFSILNFYERRARRILPALFVVLLVTSFVLPLITSKPNLLSNYGESMLSVVFFASNIYFFNTSGYFGTASELSPLLHTWSLAVEEQYYLIFPLFTVFCLRYGIKIFILSLSLVSLVSIGIAEWGWRHQPIGNFYLIPTRAWELLVGSLGAIIATEITKIFSERLRSVFAALGIVLVLSSYILFCRTTPHPSILTFIPVFGSLLIILFANKSNTVGKILSSALLTHIGLISYSLYLWHQPILSLAKLDTKLQLDTITQVSLLLAIYLISLATFKFVETPFRKKQKFSQQTIFRLSAIGAGVISLGASSLILNFHIQKYFFPVEMDRYTKLIAADNDHTHQMMIDEGCKFWSDKIDSAFKNRFAECSKKHGKAIVVLGGSHGMDLYNAIATNSTYEFITSISSGSCRAHDFIEDFINPPKCQYKEFLDFSSHNANQISEVIYTQTPDRLFKKSMSEAEESDLSEKHIDQVVSYLSKLQQGIGLKVLMIGMLPPMNKSPIELNYKLELESQLENNMSKKVIELTKYVDHVFKEKLTPHNIPYITKMEGFKLSFPKDLMLNGELTYSDSRHLSKAGEREFGRRLISFLQLNSQYIALSTSK